MNRLLLGVLLIVATNVAVSESRGQAPTPPPNTRLQFTTSSPEARSALEAAWDDGVNVFIPRALIESKKAVMLDSTFGLARAFWAYNSGAATGLAPADRERELNRAVADASRATTGELLMALAMRAQALQRLEEARTLSAAAVALMPDEPLANSFRAVNAPVADRMALQLEMTRKFPTFPSAQYRLGILQLNAGDTAAAVKTFQEYLRLAPKHPNAHDAYASVLAQTGRPAEAIPHFEHAVQLDPTFTQSFAGMAASHTLLKQYPEAIADAKRALAVDPSLAVGYQIIGGTQLTMGQPDQARATFVGSAEKVATPAAKAAALISGALMYVPMGKPKDAVTELTALAGSFEQQSLRAQTATAYSNAALLDAAFGDRKAVAGRLEKARAAAPPPAPNAAPAAGAQPFRILALAQALSGQVDSARIAAAMFAQAVTAGTPAQRNNSHELNAIVAVGEKNFDRAKEELAQAGPNATLGKAMLAEALKKSGKKAEATALKAEILSRDPAPTVFDVIARSKVQKI